MALRWIVQNTAAKSKIAFVAKANVAGLCHFWSHCCQLFATVPTHFRCVSADYVKEDMDVFDWSLTAPDSKNTHVSPR